MPKIIELRDQQVSVSHGKDIDQKATAKNGEPVMMDVWALQMLDRKSGDVHVLKFTKDLKDHLVRELTGVVLPGGMSV